MSTGPDLSNRRQAALQRIQELLARFDLRAAKAWRNYYTLQILTVALAALTPCMIILWKENPWLGLLNWLQLFFPAVAAIAAGLSAIFRWREDGVRFTNLAEGIRSQLWRYQTRSGDIGPALTEDQALDRLVTRIDEMIVQSTSQWAAAQLSAPPAPNKSEPAAAHA
jgi:hypothetical protein